MKIRDFLFAGEDDIWYSDKDNTGFSYEDKIGSIIESPHESFKEGDYVCVKKKDSERIFREIGDGIFIRGRNVYSCKEFCPRHEVRKMKDEKYGENYCPLCET